MIIIKKNGSPRKLNTKIFKEKVAELYDDEYTVLGEYINSKTTITHSVSIFSTSIPNHNYHSVLLYLFHIKSGTVL